MQCPGIPGIGIHRCEGPEMGMGWVRVKSPAEASGWSWSWSWSRGQGPGHAGHLDFILNVMDSPW